MWVADMDFPAPQAVIEAIQARAAHGVFGYNEPPPGLVDVVLARLQDRYGIKATEEHLVFGPGVVPALNQACRGLLDDGEAVATIVPVYHPFLAAPGNFGRELHRVHAVETPDGWRYPMDQLRALFREHPEIRLYMLCNPHNPIGRCLTAEEVYEVVEICLEHDVLIVSDEIHCDLLFDNRTHAATLAVHPRAHEITVAMMAASKTFNVAGLGGYVAIIPNPALRERYEAAGEGIMANVTTFGFTALQVAWRDCADWHEALLAYLTANRSYLAERVSAIPGMSMGDVQGTYLAWLDVRDLELDDPMAFFEAAGVGLSPGEQFDGHGFMRLNFACPRSTLEEACNRVSAAVAALV